VDPCPACNRLARSLVQAAQVFGGNVAHGKRVSERVCADHLPLVVGFTAPRDLAKWLLSVLDGQRQDPSVSPGATCPLCEAQEEAREEARRFPVTPTTCAEHGGEPDAFPEDLRKALERITAGERLEMREERRALRTALVLYASLRGTSAFIPRID
jgi:hypothetical protein